MTYRKIRAILQARQECTKPVIPAPQITKFYHRKIEFTEKISHTPIHLHELWRKIIVLFYGFSYYPEHCSGYEEIDKDIDLIVNSNATVVRMGEFAWDYIEHSEGEFRFDYFDYTINKLGEKGIKTIFCTPTASPPSWLFFKHPDIAYVDHRGFRRPFGARHHYCYNNETYREYSKKITKKIAEHYVGNDNIIGFQSGNEYAQESSGRCHCDTCTKKFQKYLKEKYGNIDNFNRKCGTNFWGDSFSSFDFVKPPLKSGEVYEQEVIKDFYDNPSLRFEFELFCSDSIVEYYNIQADILSTTNKTITSNSTGIGTNLINYYDFFRKSDVYGIDIYPSLFNPSQNIFDSEFSYAMGYCLKEKPFWILEYSIGGGHGLWAKEGRLQPYPGSIELCVLHSFWNGASLLAHFQYKTFRYGAEQLNYAMLDADRVPRRRYKEFQKTALLINQYSDLIDSTSIEKSKIAIVFDYHSLWSLKIKPIHHDFLYTDSCVKLYSLIRKCGFKADIISPDVDFSKYSMVIIPTKFVISDFFANKLRNYVKNGGTVVSTFLTGVKNMNNVALDCNLPGMLSDLFGIIVSEVEPVFNESVAEVEMALSNNIVKTHTKYWVDVLELTEATPLATISTTYRKGCCIASENHFNSGRAYYLGTMFDDNAIVMFIRYLASLLNIEPYPFKLDENVSVSAREGKKGEKYFCIFNFNKTETTVTLSGKYKNIISNESLTGEIKLKPMQHIIITAI